MVILPLILACTGTPATDDTAPDTTGDTDTPAPEVDGSVTLTDENNFTYEGLLDAPSFALAERTDNEIDWSDLATDLRCHDLDPVADIDNAALLVFPYLSEEEVEQGLSDDSMAQADLEVYLSYEPGDATALRLSDFTFFSTVVDIQERFEEGTGTWLVVLTSGTIPAVGGRMLTFIRPTAGETTDRVTLDDGCPVLDFSADLSQLRHVPVLRDGPWLLDWSALTRDGHANDFVSTKIDGVMVARFDEDISELEANFLDLELLAEETWTYTHSSGVSEDLGAMSGASDPFPGFDGDGTWLLALTCSTCPNPAPIFLTVLEPE